MTIQIGDSIPKTSFVIMTPDGPEQRSSDQIFKGKKIHASLRQKPFARVSQQYQRVQRERNR
jgi:hypothetical protein